MNIQPTFSLILALLLATVLGIAYNYFVARLNAVGDSEGYTAVLVAGGVLLTLAFATPFISLEHALIVTAFFIATGTPMLLGDIVRYARKRKHGRKLLK